jgi:UDP-N-acetylglucosamine acyltransferase
MIHATAQVHPEAKLHATVEVGPWCVIGPNVKVGKGTKLQSHVVLDGWTEIGEDNVIFPFAVLGAVPQDLKYKGEVVHLTIGDRNTIREGVTINMGTVQDGGLTSVGNDNLLMSYVHLGHDCHVRNHCVIATHTGLSGHVTVEDYAILGGMVGVVQFLRIGMHSYIAGQTGLTKEVPPFTIVEGQRPPVIRGVNIVGLRRRGYSADTIMKINETVKLWVRPDVPKEQCLLEMESQYGEIPEVQQFLRFIRESEHGVIK